MPLRLPFRGTKPSPKSITRSSIMSTTTSTTSAIHWPSSSSSSSQAQRATFHGLTSSTTTTTHQEPPPPPVLLLQGDELHLSPEGIARSCYHLASNTARQQQQWTIEEQYRLEDCTKSFVIRCPLSSNFLQQPSTSTNTTTIQLQEVDTRLAGTGGTTWEASVAMALYFAARNTANTSHDNNVVEIGCGVGLGGMLLHHVLTTQQQLASSSSITLTDGCEKVVEQCRDNVERYLKQHPQQANASKLQVKQLDWNDVLQQQQQSAKTKDDNSLHQYNTVIACDCAYRQQDVLGLTETLKALLKRDDNNNNNRIHVFGPYNRVAYQDVIETLQQDKDLEVQVEWMELSRYRLAASHHNNSTQHQDATCVAQFPSAQHHHHKQFNSQYQTNRNDDIQQLENELQEANKSSAKFLHVIAKWKNQQSLQKFGVEEQQNSSLSDID